MLQHCILGVDYSTDWDRAHDHLPAIAQLIGLQRLTLVYVVETHKRQHIEDHEGNVESRLKTLSAQLGQELGIATDWQIRRGFAASEIIDVTRKQHADAIITLNKSHSSGREFFLGNVAMNLARMTPVPLLMLSSDGGVIEPHAPVIFATDGSSSTHRAQQHFETLAKAGQHGLAIWVDADEHDDEEAAHRILSNLAASYPNVAARRLKGSASYEIDQAATQEKAALVIIGKRGTTPIKELLLGSTAENIARKCRQPVLLVPNH